jgi:hypothetical protein
VCFRAARDEREVGGGNARQCLAAKFSGYNTGLPFFDVQQVIFMSNHDPIQQHSTNTPDNGDGAADIMSTIAIITLVVGAVSFWLHSFPH